MQQHYPYSPADEAHMIEEQQRETHERAALASGYVRCTNRPTRWYPSGPNLPAPQHHEDVHITPEGIELRHWYTGEVLARHATFERFIVKCTRKSEGGASHIPARFVKAGKP